MTLTEFLLARIAEDEGCALALPPVIIADAVRYERIHFARWAPARVVVECVAKRLIVGLHTSPDGHECPERADLDEWNSLSTGFDRDCPTLKLLALPYTDHPDYLPEWKP